jgi:hypothetical protein
VRGSRDQSRPLSSLQGVRERYHRNTSHHESVSDLLALPSLPGRGGRPLAVSSSSLPGSRRNSVSRQGRSRPSSARPLELSRMQSETMLQAARRGTIWSWMGDSSTPAGSPSRRLRSEADLTSPTSVKALADHGGGRFGKQDDASAPSASAISVALNQRVARKQEQLRQAGMELDEELLHPRMNPAMAVAADEARQALKGAPSSQRELAAVVAAAAVAELEAREQLYPVSHRVRELHSAGQLGSAAETELKGAQLLRSGTVPTRLRAPATDRRPTVPLPESPVREKVLPLTRSRRLLSEHVVGARLSFGAVVALESLSCHGDGNVAHSGWLTIHRNEPEPHMSRSPDFAMDLTWASHGALFPERFSSAAPPPYVTLFRLLNPDDPLDRGYIPGPDPRDPAAVACEVCMEVLGQGVLLGSRVALRRATDTLSSATEPTGPDAATLAQPVVGQGVDADATTLEAARIGAGPRNRLLWRPAALSVGPRTGHEAWRVRWRVRLHSESEVQQARGDGGPVRVEGASVPRGRMREGVGHLSVLSLHQDIGHMVAMGEGLDPRGVAPEPGVDGAPALPSLFPPAKDSEDTSATRELMQNAGKGMEVVIAPEPSQAALRELATLVAEQRQRDLESRRSDQPNAVEVASRATAGLVSSRWVAGDVTGSDLAARDAAEFVARSPSTSENRHRRGRSASGVQSEGVQVPLVMDSSVVQSAARASLHELGRAPPFVSDAVAAAAVGSLASQGGPTSGPLPGVVASHRNDLSEVNMRSGAPLIEHLTRSLGWEQARVKMVGAGLIDPGQAAAEVSDVSRSRTPKGKKKPSSNKALGPQPVKAHDPTVGDVSAISDRGAAVALSLTGRNNLLMPARVTLRGMWRVHLLSAAPGTLGKKKHGGAGAKQPWQQQAEAEEDLTMDEIEEQQRLEALRPGLIDPSLDDLDRGFRHTDEDSPAHQAPLLHMDTAEKQRLAKQAELELKNEDSSTMDSGRDRSQLVTRRLHAEARAETWRRQYKHWQDERVRSELDKELGRPVSAVRLSNEQLMSVRRAAAQGGRSSMAVTLDVGAAQLDMGTSAPSKRAVEHLLGAVTRGMEGAARDGSLCAPEEPSSRLWTAKHRAETREEQRSRATERRLEMFSTRLKSSSSEPVLAKQGGGPTSARHKDSPTGSLVPFFLQDGAQPPPEGQPLYNEEDEEGDDPARVLLLSPKASVLPALPSVGQSSAHGFQFFEPPPSPRPAERTDALPVFRVPLGFDAVDKRLSTARAAMLAGGGPPRKWTPAERAVSQRRFEAKLASADSVAAGLEGVVSPAVRRTLRSSAISVGLLLRQAAPAHKAVIAIQRRFRVRRRFRWLRGMQLEDAHIHRAIRAEGLSGKPERVTGATAALAAAEKASAERLARIQALKDELDEAGRLSDDDGDDDDEEEDEFKDRSVVREAKDLLRVAKNSEKRTGWDLIGSVESLAGLHSVQVGVNTMYGPRAQQATLKRRDRGMPSPRALAEPSSSVLDAAGPVKRGPSLRFEAQRPPLWVRAQTADRATRGRKGEAQQKTFGALAEKREQAQLLRTVLRPSTTTGSRGGAHQVSAGDVPGVRAMALATGTR